MAREPPAVLSGSELRDLSLQPTTVRSAKITIIHPQLRDLILPLERGRVLYPRGQTVEEARWSPPSSELQGEDEGGEIHKGGISGGTRPFLNLKFTPNCLTASGNLFACGGQHGELHVTNLPSPSSGSSSSPTSSSGDIRTRDGRKLVKPFTLSTTLPSRSINNSMLILPAWPHDWKRREEEKRAGFIGRNRRRSFGMDGQGQGYEDDDGWREESDGEEEMRETSVFADAGPGVGEDEEEDEDENEEGEEDDNDEDEDTGMDIDEDNEETFQVGSPASSVATYPNTVPFLHAPRIPHLSPTRSTHTSASYRSTSFGSDRPRPQSAGIGERAGRLSFSHHSTRSGQPPIEVVTSAPVPGPSNEQFHPVGPIPVIPANPSPKPTLKSRKLRKRLDEPRLLISNNDQSIKMFSLRAAGPSSKDTSDTATAYETRFTSSRISNAATSSSSTNRYRLIDPQPSSTSSATRTRPRMGTTANSLPPLRLGSGFGWDSVATLEGINPSLSHPTSHPDTQERSRSPAVILPSRRWYGSHSHRAERNRDEEERHRYTLDEDAAWEPGRVEFERRRREFERTVGIRIGDPALAGSNESACPAMMQDKEEERKLFRVGGSQFKFAVNHSSLSPDLKTMVTVGDSTDVFLHEVIEGGKEFRRIGVYTAATDYGFSTAWCKDGRKFAVASQDGQVTVWDHRSSRPLAIFHTSNNQASAPSFTSDIISNRLGPTSSSSSMGAWELPDADGYPMLIDPVTGQERQGTSTSGREAARVVKFSPEGSDRDLMVFSEERTNIHIIDAKTFNIHVVIPVPIANSTFTSSLNAEIPRGNRAGVENGTWGIAGVAFDPTGNWLYSGTERSVVEWDLRRYGGGEGGTWSMC